MSDAFSGGLSDGPAAPPQGEEAEALNVRPKASVGSPEAAPDLFEASLQQIDAQLAATAPTSSPERERAQLEADITGDQTIVGNQRASEVVSSMLLGVAKAGFEVKDTIFGEPNFEDKSSVRRAIERKAVELERLNVVNGLARNITQFGAGFLGVGKLTPFKHAEGLSRLGRDVFRGAVTGATAFDPHEERLANVIEKFPALNNPVTAYLAADLKDGKAEGRLKAALESVILDTTVVTAFTLAMRAMRLGRHGDTKGAQAAMAEADEAFTKSALKFWYDNGTPTSVDAGASPAGPGAGASGAQVAPTASPTAGGPGRGLAPAAGGPAPNPGGIPGGNLQGDSGIGDGGLLRPTGLAAAAGGPPPRAGASAGSSAGGPGGGPIPTGGTTEALTGAEARGVRADGKRGAINLPEIVVTPQTIKRMRKDNAAIKKHGSVERAIDEGYKFGAQDVIPYQKLGGPEQVRAFVGNIVEQNIELINKAKGGRSKGGTVQSDAELEDMVGQRARMFNEDPAIMMGLIKRQGNEARTLAANMEAGFLIANKAAEDAYHLARRIDAENYTGYPSKDAADADLKFRLGVMMEVVAASKSILANAARSVRRARSEFQVRSEDMARINITSMSPDAIRKAILATGGDPAGLSKLGRPGYFNLLVDYIGGLQAANLLWGWSTHAINLGMNVAMTQVRPLETFLGGVGLGVKAALRGDTALRAQAKTIRTRARREAIATSAQIADGWSAATWAFLNGDSRLAPHGTEFFNVGQRPGLGAVTDAFRPNNSVGDVIHNAISGFNLGAHGSLRAMGAIDEMVKTIRYRAVVMAKASTDADEMGLTAGTKAYRDYVKDRVEASFDPNGRALDGDALEEARTTTFQNELIGSGTDETFGGRTSLGALWQQGVSQAPVLKLMTPFVKTPTNLFRYSVKLTPGLNLLQKEFQNAIRGAKGAEAQARAIGQMSLGILLVGTAIQLRLNGSITGSGPLDIKANQAWKSQGNSPYSLVSTDEETGEKTFIQLNRLDPIQFPLTLVADVTDLLMQGVLSEKQENDLATATLLAVSHQLKDKLYLKNISEFLQAATDSKRLAELPKRLAPGFIPFSTLFRGVNPDPYIHETYGVVDALKASMPGFSDTVPKRYDVFGEPIKIPDRFYTTSKNVGPLGRALDESFAHTGTFITPPVPRVGTDNVDLRDVTIEGGKNAFEAYQAGIARPVGRVSLKEAMTRLVETDTYKQAPHGRASENSTKEFLLMQVVGSYREKAMENLKARSPMLREVLGKRAQDILQATVAGRKSAAVRGSQAGADAINRLGAAFGVGVPRPQDAPLD